MRVSVRKTYKLFINGQFPRSESGHHLVVRHQPGEPMSSGQDDGGEALPEVTNVCLGSRKDVRDAVRAARLAWPGWSQSAAMLRGLILHRIAEMLDARAVEFTTELVRMGASSAEARAEVQATSDTFLHYAGWADKFPHLLGCINPVAGPYYNFSVPEPMGVVAIVAPETPALLGLVQRLAPALVAGNTIVALTSEARPLAALTLGEVLATSDVPPGVVNIISGRVAELAPQLASHMDVNALDVSGVNDSAALEIAAAENLKRVVRAPSSASGSLAAIESFTESKTIWHPVGM